jgi:cellulose synthase/poly-beta-1,6-N-acetylglucosamine synthase-like glycosyltransferase
VRHDQERRGKGYALAYAFERLAGGVDALVVVDADTVVSPNLLRAFAARIDAGALAVQADYAVRNPGASWRTRLMAIAFGAFHVCDRSPASDCGFRRGCVAAACFTSQVLSLILHDACSIVEDVEYGIRLGEAGHRVYYAAEAHVYGEMVSSSRASQSQRQRWSGGERLARTRGLPLSNGFRATRSRPLDLAIDILLPPLSTLATWVILGLGVALLSGILFSQPVSLRIWIANLVALVLYVLRGWSLWERGRVVWSSSRVRRSTWWKPGFA